MWAVNSNPQTHPTSHPQLTVSNPTRKNMFFIQPTIQTTNNNHRKELSNSWRQMSQSLAARNCFCMGIVHCTNQLKINKVSESKSLIMLLFNVNLGTFDIFFICLIHIIIARTKENTKFTNGNIEPQELHSQIMVSLCSSNQKLFLALTATSLPSCLTARWTCARLAAAMGL